MDLYGTLTLPRFGQCWGPAEASMARLRNILTQTLALSKSPTRPESASWRLGANKSACLNKPTSICNVLLFFIFEI